MTCMAYERTSPDSSFHFINQSLQLSNRTNNLNGIVRSMLLVKEMVELNGGLLSVESKLGHGTTFFLSVLLKMSRVRFAPKFCIYRRPLSEYL
jgi:light-regulated signal transduction histidine kinase (bacteriophytochrome)